MNTIQNIFGRHSIRTYEDRQISETDIQTILEAGMSGPSCANKRDWSFIVVRDKATLNKMADANGIHANALRSAAMGILICGDLDRAFPAAKDYWIIDGAIAGQNMTLAARELGIGSVWLGTWPEMVRVENQTKLFGLPASMVPHSVLAFGYSEACSEACAREYDMSRVHFEKW